MEETTISSEIFRALGYLLIAFVAFIAYFLGKKGVGYTYSTMYGDTETRYNEAETKRSVLVRLAKGLGSVIVIGFLASYVFMGTSSDCSEADPIRGGCETSQEYVPTSEERAAKFSYWITLLGIPFAAGVSEAYTAAGRRELHQKQNSDLKVNE